MKIYFAGSITGGRDDKEIYLQMIGLLGKRGKVLTEHIGDAALTAQGEPLPREEIYRRDMAWLTESDAVVAEVTHPSLGVGYEISKTEDMKKPLLCLYRPGEGRRLSAMIAGIPGIRVREYNSLEELPPIFEDFFKKK